MRGRQAMELPHVRRAAGMGAVEGWDWLPHVDLAAAGLGAAPTAVFRPFAPFRGDRHFWIVLTLVGEIDWTRN